MQRDFTSLIGSDARLRSDRRNFDEIVPHHIAHTVNISVTAMRGSNIGLRDFSPFFLLCDDGAGDSA